jgi:hypothetical protein
MPRAAALAHGALLRRAPLAAVALLAACAGAPRPRGVPRELSHSPGAAAPAPPSTRFVHALADAGFWVTHDDTLDRVVVEGARLELAPSGQVLRAAWDDDPLERGDPIVGSIAAPTQQGGGFVHWTRSRLFRSSAFTGPIEPIAAGRDVIRGVRPGLEGLVVVTETGPRALLDGGRRLGPFAEPSLLDVVAAGPERAIRLDVFGRAGVTFDGGRAWLDLASSAGIAVRAVSAEEGELGVETWRGRFLVGPGGKLAPAPPSSRSSTVKAFQIPWKGTRAERDDGAYRETSPLQAAVLAGAAVGDGTAYGVAEGTLMRVELATGKLVSAVRDGLESGLECQPLSAGGEVLLGCVWNRFQSAGGYVLRASGGAPPVVERVFTDAGSFVADDDGALGYTGSCAVTPRLDDADEAVDRFEGLDPRIPPVLCVRRAPPGSEPGAGPGAEWVERAVDLEPRATLAAWIPHRDGTATALVIDGGALPPAVGEARARTQGGVRVVRVERAPSKLRWKVSPWSQRGRDGGQTIDQRFHERADGTIDAWLAPEEEGPLSVLAAVTVAREGTASLRPLPPEIGSMQATGAFGAAISRHGDLFETLDHGRSWRAVGRSPLPPTAALSGGCSAIGCVLGSLVRLGWGPAAGLDVSVAIEPEPEPEPAPAPRRLAAPALPTIACAPRGAPRPEVPPAPLPARSKQGIATGWGDTIDLWRDQATPAAPTSKKGAPLAPAPSPAPSASASAGPRAAKAPPVAAPALADRPTHALLFRQPLAPFAAARRIDLVAPEINPQRRSQVTPLLGAAGAVDLLLGFEATEVLVTGARAAATPLLEPRRYGGSSAGLLPAGLALGGERSLLLGETRRRLTLEEHRAAPAPPLFLGVDREAASHRPMTLGRRDDGAAGVLVFDGAAPETAGVTPLDPGGGGLLAQAKLAPWSTATRGDDPRCKAPDPTAYRALVVLDPSAWLTLDSRSLPGVTLGSKGLAEVRWGRERVCLVAIDAAVDDARRRGDSARSLRLVVRWDSQGAAPNGALRAPDLRQDLQCSLAPPEAAR